MLQCTKNFINYSVVILHNTFSLEKLLRICWEEKPRYITIGRSPSRALHFAVALGFVITFTFYHFYNKKASSTGTPRTRHFSLVSLQPIIRRQRKISIVTFRIMLKASSLHQQLAFKNPLAAELSHTHQRIWPSHEFRTAVVVAAPNKPGSNAMVSQGCSFSKIAYPLHFCVNSTKRHNINQIKNGLQMKPGVLNGTGSYLSQKGVLLRKLHRPPCTLNWT